MNKGGQIPRSIQLAIRPPRLPNRYVNKSRWLDPSLNSTGHLTAPTARLLCEQEQAVGSLTQFNWPSDCYCPDLPPVRYVNKGGQIPRSIQLAIRLPRLPNRYVNKSRRLDPSLNSTGHLTAPTARLLCEQEQAVGSLAQLNWPSDCPDCPTAM